jgi:hypothetical protein
VRDRHHDGKGNIAAVGTDSYGYSSENFLTSGPGSTSLSYDPMGRLYQVAQGATTTRIGYDGLDRIAEYDGSNAVLEITVTVTEIPGSAASVASAIRLLDICRTSPATLRHMSFATVTTDPEAGPHVRASARVRGGATFETFGEAPSVRTLGTFVRLSGRHGVNP